MPYNLGDLGGGPAFVIENLYFLIVWGWTLTAIPTFILLLKLVAPFGRHRTDKWGPTISNKWAWFVMELPALFVLPAYYFAFATDHNPITLFLIAAWALHYTNRSCVFPFRIHTRGKTMPLVIAAMAFVFNVTNGVLCGHYFAYYADYTAAHWLSPFFILGLALFVGGMAINWRSDNILISLRKIHTKDYVIPEGGLFRWVSCPNLMGEIVEWCGFALMAMTLPTTAFALWTIANLLPRALAHHRWYRQKFPTYPSTRKAVIPFVV